MAEIGGYAIITSPDGIVEMDTITCGHCNRVRHRKPLPGGRMQALDDISVKCLGCGKRQCFDCAKLQRCIPLERQIEAMERAIERNRSNDMLYRAATAGW